MHDDTPEPARRVRARHTDTTITVYQAYGPDIGPPAARDGRFPAAWRRGRMTWVKPSFLWMMYRSSWGTAEGQRTVLAIDITRAGFDRALREACLSHYDRDVHAGRAEWRRQVRRSPVRVQWDPERDLALRPLPYRSLQLGLSGEASARFADAWITGIEDVTALGHDVHALVREGRTADAARLLPRETPYVPAAGTALTHLGG